jgi:tetratricopeptide (TPR) repeat protein
MTWQRSICTFTAAILLVLPGRLRAAPDASFLSGIEAYGQGDYAAAAQAFAESARKSPAAGTLENLGLAEWRLGRPGPAILAWEQSIWIDPFNEKVRTNLRYARKAAQVESPEMAWYEVVSTWLPADWWAWLAGVGLWSAVALTMLPGIFRWRRAGWQQAVAAFGIMIFLLSLPAHLGVFTRSRLGFFLEKETEVRLTPTRDGPVIARMSAGEPARWERTRGAYILVHTSRGSGWVEQNRLGTIFASSKKS